MKKLWFIPPPDFLTTLATQDKEALFALGTWHTYKKNTLIFQAGSAGDYVYFLLSGQAKIYQLSHSSGKEVILWFCFSGEMFGLAEVCRQGEREVYARACSPTNLIKISQKDFKAFLLNHPQAAMLMIDMLSCRLRMLGNMLLNLATDDVTSRLIKLLIHLIARYSKSDGPDIYLDIHLTHQEIADMIGASRQTVSSILGQLRREGIVHIEKHCIHIQSPERLENMIEYKPEAKDNFPVATLN